MTVRVRPKSPIPAEYVGYTMPLKEILGIGAFQGERRPDVDLALKAQADNLKDLIFGKLNPTHTQILAKIEDGTIDDYRRPKTKASDDKFKTFGELQLYLERLAYHYYVKRDTLRLATQHGIVITHSPLSKVVGYPLETLVVPANRGRKALDGFFDDLGKHMLSRYNIEILKPDEVDNEKTKGLTGFQINHPQSLMTNPEKFKTDLRRQNPPTTHEVAEVRRWFNDWYKSSRQITEAIIDETARGEMVEHGELLPGIKSNLHTKPKDRIKTITENRI